MAAQTWAELWSSASSEEQQFVLASVGEAPPFTSETRTVLRQVFSGVGDRIAAQRHEAAPEAA